MHVSFAEMNDIYFFKNLVLANVIISKHCTLQIVPNSSTHNNAIYNLAQYKPSTLTTRLESANPKHVNFNASNFQAVSGAIGILWKFVFFWSSRCLISRTLTRSLIVHSLHWMTYKTWHVSVSLYSPLHYTHSSPILYFIRLEKKRMEPFQDCG